MRILIGIMLPLILLAAPAAAQKVTIDYAKEMDFGNIGSFKYIETGETGAGNPMMAERIVEAIRAKLRENGLREVEQDPDIYVTYHLALERDLVLSTSGYGYGGYGAGWGRWRGGRVHATTTATTYTTGTLVIDAYDAADKKMVWRGTGSVTVASKPEKQIKQVSKILEKMGNKWQKILRNEGK